jgi:hypothetical protein
VAELLAAILLSACCLAPACHRPADPGRLLAISEQQGAVGRPLNYPEAEHG